MDVLEKKEAEDIREAIAESLKAGPHEKVGECSRMQPLHNKTSTTNVTPDT